MENITSSKGQKKWSGSAETSFTRTGCFPSSITKKKTERIWHCKWGHKMHWKKKEEFWTNVGGVNLRTFFSSAWRNNYKSSLLLRVSGNPEWFTGSTSTVAYTSPMTLGPDIQLPWHRDQIFSCHDTRTRLGASPFGGCIAHRKVTSCWFISQVIKSTGGLLKLLNLTCRETDWCTRKICSGRGCG